MIPVAAQVPISHYYTIEKVAPIAMLEPRRIRGAHTSKDNIILAEEITRLLCDCVYLEQNRRKSCKGQIYFQGLRVINVFRRA
jgi:hypothetical protein